MIRQLTAQDMYTTTFMPPISGYEQGEVNYIRLSMMLSNQDPMLHTNKVIELLENEVEDLALFTKDLDIQRAERPSFTYEDRRFKTTLKSGLEVVVSPLLGKQRALMGNEVDADFDWQLLFATTTVTKEDLKDITIGEYEAIIDKICFLYQKTSERILEIVLSEIDL